MTDLDVGGSLDGWDDELNDWTDDDAAIDAENETDAKLRLDAEREAVELNGGCMCPMGADVCHCGAEQRIAKFAAADAALERRRVRRGICIRDRPEGGVCNQGYDHTGHCDWWSSPAVTDALASIQPNPRIERAQAAYNAALLDELPDDRVTEQQAAAEFDAAKAHIAGYLTDDKPRPTTPDLMAPLVESMRLAAERRSHHDD